MRLKRSHVVDSGFTMKRGGDECELLTIENLTVGVGLRPSVQYIQGCLHGFSVGSLVIILTIYSWSSVMQAAHHKGLSAQALMEAGDIKTRSDLHTFGRSRYSHISVIFNEDPPAGL